MHRFKYTYLTELSGEPIEALGTTESIGSDDFIVCESVIAHAWAIGWGFRWEVSAAPDSASWKEISEWICQLPRTPDELYVALAEQGPRVSREVYGD